MKRATRLLAGGLMVGSLLACENDPVGEIAQPQVIMTADSIAVNTYASATVSAAIHNTIGQLQFVSRDESVASVTGVGTVTGLATGSTYIVAALAGQPGVRDSVRVRVYSDSCGGARPDFGVATAADRALFSYDVNAPLNLQKTLESTINGVNVSTISYSSPDGGLVTGLMWEPIGRAGLRPGIVLMHGHPATARNMTFMAQPYAQYGAVVIAIDAPFARRATGPIGMTLSPQDAFEQVQVIKDLQRAVDVLRSHPNVDDDRIAYIGVSWGGATGALFVGIERRLKAAALVVGHPGQVSHATGPGGFKQISFLPCSARVAWIRAMSPVEPVRYVGNANVPLLVQNGQFDEFIPVYEALELHAALPQPRDVRWYDTGHNLNQTAVFHRHDWLVQHIGLDAR